MQDVTFRSKVDAWLVALVLASIGLTLFQAGRLLTVAPRESLLGLAIVAVTIVLIALLSVPCTYTLTATHLVVRSGIVRLRIAYGDISAVARSRSLWAGPALSLQRVKVSYAGRFVLVSPKDRDRFIDELQQRVDSEIQSRK